MVAAQDFRVTVITGGGSGMGRATAVRLAQRGDSVCICDLKEDGINESAELIRSVGHTAYTGIVDVRNQAQVQAWIAEVIGKFGKIDCLFSNAGLNARATVADMTLAQWSLLIDTHVTGTFNFCQAVLRNMVERNSGSIVITSSDFAIVGVPNADYWRQRRRCIPSRNLWRWIAASRPASASMPLVLALSIHHCFAREGLRKNTPMPATSLKAGCRSNGSGGPRKSQLWWIFC